MRSTTRFAHMMRACILALAVMALPQLASAQLPLETKSLNIQAQTGTNAVTLTTPTAVTSYSITLPGALGTANAPGAFMYTNNTTGGLAWTNTPNAAGWSLRWSGSAIEWFDPAGADNPNWARAGNNVAAGTYKLGTTGAVDANINIVTRDVVRMSFAGTTDGKISVTAPMDINASGSDATNIGTGATAGTVTIGRTAGTLTTIGSLGHTGTSSFTGSVTLAGANSPLVANTGAGSNGDVLVSAGAGNTPTWTSLADATGIRARGTQSLTANDVSKTVTVATLALGDIVIVTMQGTASAVSATVTNVAAGSFTVTFSGAIPTGGGQLNYLIMKP